jgi:hypothetical protein
MCIPPVVPRQRFREYVPAATNTRNNRRIVGVVLYAILVLSKESLWVCVSPYRCQVTTLWIRSRGNEELLEGSFSVRSVSYQRRVCGSVYPPLSLSGNNSVNTFPRQRRIVGGVVSYAVHVVSEKSRRLILYGTSYLIWKEFLNRSSENTGQAHCVGVSRPRGLCAPASPRSRATSLVRNGPCVDVWRRYRVDLFVVMWSESPCDEPRRFQASRMKSPLAHFANWNAGCFTFLFVLHCGILCIRFFLLSLFPSFRHYLSSPASFHILPPVINLSKLLCTNSECCHHCVFICFSCDSDSKPIIFINTVNRWVFVDTNAFYLL